MPTCALSNTYETRRAAFTVSESLASERNPVSHGLATQGIQEICWTEGSSPSTAQVEVHRIAQTAYSMCSTMDVCVKK